MGLSTPSQYAAAVVALVLCASCGQSPSSPHQYTVKTVTAEQIRGLLASETNRVTLLHVWATWCPPCVNEFPDIVALAKKHREDGLQVLLVSADAQTNVAAVSRFLAAHGVDWQSYLAANVNDSFIRAISPAWSGALPASFYYAADGTLAEAWEGSRSYATHEATVLRVLKQPQLKQEGR
ncbi:MAG: TlpA disulfide reductase family protein [Kiritimatiellae bacterium]|nr:TlpA disulfide reductase family protein [Kiritimatiellia bacterium]